MIEVSGERGLPSIRRSMLDPDLGTPYDIKIRAFVTVLQGSKSRGLNVVILISDEPILKSMDISVENLIFFPQS